MVFIIVEVEAFAIAFVATALAFALAALALGAVAAILVLVAVPAHLLAGGGRLLHDLASEHGCKCTPKKSLDRVPP
jgi:hypothetical protein